MGPGKFVDTIFFLCNQRPTQHSALNQQIFRASFRRRGQEGKLLRFFGFCGRSCFGGWPQLHIHFLIIDQHGGAYRLITLTGDVVQPGSEELAEPGDLLFLRWVCGVRLLIHADAAVFIAERPQGPGLRVNQEVHIGVIHSVAILHIVMFHAVVIAVFVVDYQGIIGVPSLQAQRFILAGYDLREQLLKTPEVLVGGGIPSGFMWGWRFFRWWNQIGLTSRHNDLLSASNRLWPKGIYFIRLWDSLGFCKYRLRADGFFRRFTCFISHSTQNIVIVGLPDLPLRGAAHFFYFSRDIVVSNGVRFFLHSYIRVNARFDQGVQQIGKAGPGEVGVAIIKIKGNAILSTEFCAVQHLALKLPVAIGREQAADLPAFFRPVVVCNAIRQHRPHRLMEFRGIEVCAGQDMLIVAADFFIGKVMFNLRGSRKRAVLCGRLSFMLRALRRLGMRLFFGQRGISTMVWSTVSSAISFRSFRWRVRSRMSSVCGIGSC